METLPQIQTIVEEYGPPLSTIVDAPWVNVTSVNGMVGDVNVEIRLDNFQPNHFYSKNTAIIHDGTLYYAKQDFTSGAAFRIGDWDYPTFNQEQADWAQTNVAANSYIKNKPTKLSQFTNDLNLISEDDVSAIVQTRIEPLETSVSTLNTQVATNTSAIEANSDRIGANTTAINAESDKIDSLTTTVTNMKTDGSVIKLGTNTVGDTRTPIYLNSGTPTQCTVGGWGGLVSTDTVGGTTIGQYLYFADSNSVSKASIGGSSSGLTLSSPAYIGSVSTSNRILTAADLSTSSDTDDWQFVSSKYVSSDSSSTQIWVTIPQAYKGFPWEYKIVFGYEITKSSSATLIVTMTMDSIKPPYDSCFIGIRQGSLVTYASSSDATFFGHEWYIYNSNESCAAEVLVSRAGSGNFWNAVGKAGGMSSGPCTLDIGSRTIGEADLDFFNLNLSNSGTWLRGSHMALFARRYN